MQTSAFQTEWVWLYEKSFILFFFQGFVETLSQTSAACKPVIRKYGTVTNLIVRAKPQGSRQTFGRISFLHLWAGGRPSPCPWWEHWEDAPGNYCEPQIREWGERKVPCKSGAWLLLLNIIIFTFYIPFSLERLIIFEVFFMNNPNRLLVIFYLPFSLFIIFEVLKSL